MYSRDIEYSMDEVNALLAHFNLDYEEILFLKGQKDQRMEQIRPVNQKQLKDAIEKYLDYGFKTKSSKTKARYKKELLCFHDYMQANFGDVIISDINLMQLDDYLIERKRKRPGRHQKLVEPQEIAPATYNLRVAALSGLFRYAKEKNWVLEAVADKLERLKVDERLPHFLHLHECNVLLQVAQNKARFSNREYAMVCFALHTGCRIEELCTAEIGDLDLLRDNVLLRGVKAGGDTIRERILPLMGDLKQVLIDWIQNGLGLEINEDCIVQNKTKSKHLFPNLTAGPGFGQAMSQNNVRQIFRRLFKAMNDELERLNLPQNKMHLTPHSLRHSFAILALDNKINIAAVQDYLGHQYLESTAIYLKLCKEDYLEIGRQFNPLVGLTIENFIEDLKKLARDGKNESD